MLVVCKLCNFLKKYSVFPLYAVVISLAVAFFTQVWAHVTSPWDQRDSRWSQDEVNVLRGTVCEHFLRLRADFYCVVARNICKKTKKILKGI
jgi:hypothetical protein